MKTINELAQLFLDIDKKLDLTDLIDGGLVVDDDLHRELYDAIDDALVEGDGVSEVVHDEGGYFYDWQADAIGYVYLAEGGVSWTTFNLTELN